MSYACESSGFEKVVIGVKGRVGVGRGFLGIDGKGDEFGDLVVSFYKLFGVLLFCRYVLRRKYVFFVCLYSGLW